MLKELSVEAKEPLDVMFVCDVAFEKQARGIMATLPFAITVKTIPSGKLRRYAHFSWWHYVRHFSIVLENIADIGKTIVGFLASLWILVKFRPEVVFAKGGYVCLPMGYAARFLRIPLVIHDSDALPGLTNRMLSRFASAIGTGMPLENYNYNPAISQYVGVPIDANIQSVGKDVQMQYRKELGFPLDKKLIVAVGGGLGSVIINTAVIAAAKALQSSQEVLFYNVTGTKNVDTARTLSKGIATYQAEAFIYKDMYKVLGAADIVITRASATTLQELAGLQKAVIAVPAKQLGDQQKNAALFAKYEAILVLQDDQLATELPGVVERLLGDSSRCMEMAKNLHTFAKPYAGRDMARIILQIANRAGSVAS